MSRVEREAHWNYQLARLERFIEEHGTLPNSRSSDPDERNLRAWLSIQRDSFRLERKRLTPSRIAGLDRVFSAWRVPHTVRRTLDEITFASTAARVTSFIQATGRWPSAESADAEERALGSWLSKQRRDAHNGAQTSTVARRELLTAMAPQWAHTAANEWMVNAKLLAAFHDVHGRWPSGRGPTAERRLGRWLCRQRNAVSSSRAATLDSLLPTWRQA